MPKGFGYGGESANQEKKNLNKDMPVVSRASGNSWMNKHSIAAGSPTQMGGSYKGSAIKLHEPGHKPDPKSGQDQFKVGPSGRPVAVRETSLSGGFIQPSAGAIKAAQEGSGIFDPTKTNIGDYKGYYLEAGTGKPTQDPSKAYGFTSHSGKFTRFGNTDNSTRRKAIEDAERQKRVYMQEQSRLKQMQQDRIDYAKAGGVIKPSKKKDPKSGK